MVQLHNLKGDPVPSCGPLVLSDYLAQTCSTPHTQEAWVSVKSKHWLALHRTQVGNWSTALEEVRKFSFSLQGVDNNFVVLEEPTIPTFMHKGRNGAVPTGFLPPLPLIGRYSGLCHLISPQMVAQLHTCYTNCCTLGLAVKVPYLDLIPPGGS